MPSLSHDASKSFSRTVVHYFLKGLPVLLLLVVYGGLVYASSGGEGGAAGHGAAAGGGESPARLKDLLFRAINFIIFLLVMIYLLKKPMKQAMANRRESIEKELQDLEAKKDEAKREYQALEKRLSSLKDEKETLLADFKAEGEKEKQKIIDNARKVASSIIEHAQVTIQQEIQKANQSLREEMADLSVKMAEDILKKNITENDQKILIGEYLAKVVTH
jgi:F-type H+-transporting ATPase subunit b